MLGKVKNKLIAVFAAALLACGSIAVANWVNAPEEPSVFEPQELIWVDAETAEAVSTESSEETDAVQTPYLEIYKINLSHDADTQLLYAVYNENFDRNSYGIKLLVWNQPQEAYTIESIEDDKNYYIVDPDEYQTIKMDGKDCVVFYTKGFPAKCYTDDVFVRAYVNVEGVEYYSEVRKFGVLEYVDSIRAKYADAVEDSKEAKTLDMLDAMLVYGAKAQIRFDYNTNRLANATYYRVNVGNGTLADGFDYGYYHAGETVTLQANPAENANNVFERWVDEKGVTVSTNPTAVITLPAATSNKTYTATYLGDGWTFVDRGTHYDILKFAGNYNNVSVPNEYMGKPVRNIIGRAFEGITTLETVEIPGNILTIGASTFSGCTSLSSVTLSDGLQSIGSDAFSGCKNLKSIHIPKSVTEISDAFAPFYNASALESITVDAGNTVYSSIDGNLYNKAATKLLRYAVAKADTSFVVPDSVTEIGESAIRNATKLTAVYIPNTVATIGAHALRNLGQGAQIYYEGGAIVDETTPAGWDTTWNSSRYVVDAWVR